VSAAVAQTAQIPSDARSLVLNARTARLDVTFGGIPIPFAVLSSYPDYSVIAGDVSQFAGQTGELRLTVPWIGVSGWNYTYLDYIRFSPSMIPEPSSLGLLALAVLLLSGPSVLHSRGKASSDTP
jgi:hypothetical protein